RLNFSKPAVWFQGASAGGLPVRNSANCAPCLLASCVVCRPRNTLPDIEFSGVVRIEIPTKPKLSIRYGLIALASICPGPGRLALLEDVRVSRRSALLRWTVFGLVTLDSKKKSFHLVRLSPLQLRGVVHQLEGLK
ncbi:hypothetical protein, partial [Endozoicomonas sp. YOMI1]|uniref:hypothetical protein n=1 Tax=Endozoicomonas sp. YOMI1 TaxID=2828739 RepID=UPI002148D83F